MTWLLWKNSLLLGAAATIGAQCLGFGAALFTLGLGQRGRLVMVGLAIAAFALPPFLVVNCWLHLLGYTGVWKSWLPLNVYSMPGAVWVLMMLYWPVTFYLLLSAWHRLPGSQIESDPLLRRGALLGTILIPMARAELFQSALLTFVLCLNNFVVPALLQVKVFPAVLWVDFNTTFSYRNAFAIGWPLVFVPAALLLLFPRRFPASFDQRQFSAALFRRAIGPGCFWVAGGATVAAVFFSIVLPVADLALAPRTWAELGPAFAAGSRAWFNSVVAASGTATLVAAAALLGWRVRAEFLLWTLFFVPGVAIGLGLILLMNRPMFGWFYQSAGIVFLAFALRYIGPGWTLLAIRLRSVNRDLIDGARLDGASPGQVLRRVRLPLVLPALATAWYLTYLLCLWDVETLILIVPPGQESVALRIFNLLHYGHNSQVNALSLLLLGAALAPLAAWISGLHLRRRWLGWKRIANLTAIIVVGGGFLVSGCAPEGSGVQRLESKFFSEVQIIGSRGTGPGQFNKPRSVVVDRHGELFVADMTGRIQRFSAEGKFINSWQMPETDKGKAKGMCLDRDGNIVVIEPHYSRLNHFDANGKLLRQWGTAGTNFGELFFPRAAALNSLGELFVSEYGRTERVQRFSPDGRVCLGAFGVPGSVPGAFNRAEGLGIGPENEVCVADSCNHRVQVFSREGKLLRLYGIAGADAGQLSYPYDVQVDSNGLHYVCEFGNSRIQIFDRAGHSLEIIGSAGAAPGQFNNPWGLAFDAAGNLYVADSMNHRVQKLIRKRGG